MELIIPFVKYSLSFRQAAACSSRRADVYGKWKKCVLNSKHDVLSNRFEHDAICDFCYAKNQSYFCTKCLYPIFRERNVERELATYAMISMCFWETVNCNRRHGGGGESDVDNEKENETNDDNCLCGVSSETIKFVWKQRLKIIWDQCVDNDCYERRHFRTIDTCVQCNRSTINKRDDDDDDDFSKFNIHLFCNECLFPLFYVKCSNNK
jgi:hypothetical protein